MIVDIVRERGPMTVAAFVDLALYHPQYGYYARAARRSGRAGDFFTSVDVGPLFGELLEIQLAEIASILDSQFSIVNFDLVEAGAGNGRLSADILCAMRARDPEVYGRVRLHLVEASGAARQAQAATLRDVFDRPFASSASLPESFDGVVVANELLDAFPVHQVVMREDGLREVYVSCKATLFGSPSLELIEGPLSTPALAEYLDHLGVTLEAGWRVEINLKAIEWIRDAARRLGRGFIILVDYGHQARDLYSAAHSSGTLATFSRHTMQGAESAGSRAPWLQNPGGQDITSHVDFTSVRRAAQSEGLTTLGFLDQTYFVMGLLSHLLHRPHPGNLESLETPANPAHLVNPVNLQLKTLLMPGGLGSMMKVLILGKGVGRPALSGCSYRMRVT